MSALLAHAKAYRALGERIGAAALQPEASTLATEILGALAVALDDAAADLEQLARDEAG